MGQDARARAMPFVPKQQKHARDPQGLSSRLHSQRKGTLTSKGRATMRKSWDAYFMDIARQVATRSTCDRKHVGCVLVVDRRIISTGYNGSVPGQPHCDDVGHDMDNDHCVRTVHAEINAVTQAARSGARTQGAHVFVNTYPCWDCFKVLLTAGVTRVVFDSEYRMNPRVENAARASNVEITKFEMLGKEGK